MLTLAFIACLADRCQRVDIGHADALPGARLSGRAILQAEAAP